MSEYSVLIPITGYVLVNVEAENEEDAKQTAMQTDITSDMIETWDTHEHIVKGNVFYGELNEIEVELDDYNDMQNIGRKKRIHRSGRCARGS